MAYGNSKVSGVTPLDGVLVLACTTTVGAFIWARRKSVDLL